MVDGGWWIVDSGDVGLAALGELRSALCVRTGRSGQCRIEDVLLFCPLM